MVHQKSIARLATLFALAIICPQVKAMTDPANSSNKSGKRISLPFETFKVPVSHLKQEIFLLPPGRENECNRKLTLKEEIECFQVALEAYYGRDFTKYCPGFAEYIAVHDCELCPWHKLNVDAISKPQVESLPLNKSIFAEAGATCSVANHVRRYNDRHAVINNVTIMTIISSMLLFLGSAYGALVSSYGYVLSPKGHLKRVPEAVNLSIIWLSYLLAAGFLAVTEDYVLYCDSSASYELQNQIREVAYAVTLVYSTSRCLRVSSDPHGEGQGISWYSYAMNNIGENNSGRIRKQNRILTIVVFIIGFRFLLAALFIFENLEYRWDDNVDYCQTSNSDPVGALSVFGRVALEFFSVVVYATGPQKKEKLKRIRYSLLVMSFVLAIAVNDIQAMAKHNSRSEEIRSYDVPGIANVHFVYVTVNIVHVTFVTLLGICEPLRTLLNRGDVSDRLHHP